MPADQKQLVKILSLWEAGELDKAMHLLKKEMEKHPDEPRAVAMAGHIYEKSGNIPIAYNLFKMATELEPQEASHWINYGRAAEDLWRTSDAERAYNRALSLTNRTSTKVHTFGNLSALHIDNGRYAKALEFVEKALRLDPASKSAIANKGFVQLALGNWKEGWANYRNTLGTDWRKRVVYNNEPEWDGSPAQSVVLYGEQGLGDEICFASMIDDAAALCTKLVVECDHRLERLYKRSFPMVTIYGTRHQKDIEWKKEDQAMDASLAIGQAAQYLRIDPTTCSKTPYLVPDPERVEMWRSLWRKKGKPVIGIAWTGGIARTGSHNRHASLSDWSALLEIDAHFVSLQYKGDESHPKVHEYPFATRTQDYDDTAALVASLDCVVSVPTAVVHLAGALGTRVIAMHGPADCWKYHCGIPFHAAEHVEWAGSWKATIGNAAKMLTGAKQEKAA